MTTEWIHDLSAYRLAKQLKDSVRRLEAGESVADIAKHKRCINGSLTTHESRLAEVTKMLADGIMVSAGKVIDANVAEERARNLVTALETMGYLK